MNQPYLIIATDRTHQFQVGFGSTHRSDLGNWRDRPPPAAAPTGDAYIQGALEPS